MLLTFQLLSTIDHLIPFSYSIGKLLPANISAKEMLRISHDISRDFTPSKPIKKPNDNSNKGLTSRELLKISQNISQYYSPKTSSNIKNLKLLSISPRQLYVYWNLGINNSPSLLPSIFNDELLLQIYSYPIENKTQKPPELIYEKPIHDFQHQKKITIPVTKNHLVYSAYISNQTAKQKSSPILKSNRLHILNGNETPSSFSDEYIHTSDNNFIESMENLTSPNYIQPNYASSQRSGQGKKSLNNE